MTKTKTITLYTYDELPTERAKERARDWYAQGQFDHEWWDVLDRMRQDYIANLSRRVRD